MPRQSKPKMPKNAGIRFDPATGQSWVAYEVTVTINPVEYGVSPHVTNREMVEAVLEALRRSAVERARKAVADEIKSLRDDVFTASAEADTAAERERKAIAEALREVARTDSHPWQLSMFGEDVCLYDSEGRGLPLADWIEQGMYRPDVSTGAQ